MSGPVRVVVEQLGETPMEALSRHVKVVEQTQPEAGPGDAVIRVRSAQVNWVDLLMLSGQYQHVPQVPYTPGMEYCGEVVALGEGPAAVSVGDRVIADGLHTGPRSKGEHQRDGGFATWAVAPANALIPIPERLSFDQGCSLLGAYETAYHCLIHRGELKAGETVLIHGASGTTGLAAVHVAKMIGAKVIATGRRMSKLELVLEQGADHAVVTTDEEGKLRRFRDDVKALTNGEGVDVVYDPVGGELSLETLRCVRFGARFLIVGWASTPFVSRGKGRRGAPNANLLPTNLIMMKSLDVRGCPAVISAHRDPAMRAARLEKVLSWVEEGRITPHVAATYDLSDIAAAMRAKWQSKHVGAVVVHPPDGA